MATILKTDRATFPVLPPPTHAKSHSVVLKKMNPEPVSQHRYFIADNHIGFDNDLYNLINNQDGKYKKQCLCPVLTYNLIWPQNSKKTAITSFKC